MLSRVSTAISNFITPLASSASAVTRDPNRRREFKRQAPGDLPQGKDSQLPKQPPQLKAVVVAPGDPPAPAAQPSKPREVPSVAGAVVQLFALFSEQRGAMLRWVGTQTYRLAARDQKKLGRFKKGSMLDDKAG